MRGIIWKRVALYFSFLFEIVQTTNANWRRLNPKWYENPLGRKVCAGSSPAARTIYVGTMG